MPERRFEFVPLWGIAVYFVYAMRRGECPTCGLKVEQVPWCDGKNQLTTAYRWFLAGWVKRLSWKGVANAFGTTWQDVFRSVKHAVKLSELLQYNLQSVRSRLMREDFRQFWEYIYPACAAKFLDEWCTRTMRSKLEPMKKVAGTLRRHRASILNWFRAEGAISAGIVEGLNTKAKLTIRKA